MNTERVYFTSIPAVSIAAAVSDCFRSKGFHTQSFAATDGQTVVQLRKDDVLRDVLGMAYALTIIATQGDDLVSVRLGGHKWIDTALSTGAALLVHPVVIGTIYGAWREHHLDHEAFDAVERALAAGATQAA